MCSRYVGEIITDQKANDLKEDSYLFNLENPVSLNYILLMYETSQVTIFRIINYTIYQGYEFKFVKKSVLIQFKIHRNLFLYSLISGC